MRDATRRVREAARDARSNDDLVSYDLYPKMAWDERGLDSPLDEDTLDEQASNQMGSRYEPRRQDAN